MHRYNPDVRLVLSLRDPTLADARERLDDRWRKEIEEIVRDGQAAGAFSDIDPGEAALAIASLLDGLTVQVRLGDAISAERMVAVAAIVAGRLLGCALVPPPPIGARDLGVETGA